MRADALGMFWQDEPVVKIKKEKIRKTPPERTWELPTYLPFLDEAIAFPVRLFTDSELIDSWIAREKLVFDIECYANYFLIAFKGVTSNRVAYFEFCDEEGMGFFTTEDLAKLKWVLESFTVVSFNGISYDLPIAALALNNMSTWQLKRATDMIITGVDGEPPKRAQDVLKIYKTKTLKDIDHIDLIEVAPLDGSLKVYAGRLHAPRMQDLPFKPNTVLSKEQRDIVRWYCVNDLQNTQLLYLELIPQIKLREDFGRMYQIDLRSKSDAQIAEAVIGEELRRMTGARPTRPEVEIGKMYRYNIPSFISFTSANMRWTLELVRKAVFYVSDGGNIALPDELKSLQIPIGQGVYTMGVGGLHSCEKSISHVADENTIIRDHDVVSYYPRIILNQNLYPLHLGSNFLKVYQTIVDRRVAAKKSGDKLTAEVLKITVNGSFGKFGNWWSILYEPSLVIQTTVTGQLCLLMLIEKFEMQGIKVVSANTDGVVIHFRKDKESLANAIIAQWEKDTNFETEEVQYSAIYSRDVNNYLAVKLDGSTKAKGVFADADLRKNPQNEICVDALKEYLTKRTPIEVTIRNCEDIKKFVSVRRVRGGCVKDKEYLGGTIRWYYAEGVEGHIITAKSGNNVPKSEGAKPILDLPEQFPNDIKYEWYIAECYSILEDLGFNKIN